MQETIFTPSMHRLNNAMTDAGFTIVLVGGAVRDYLMGVEPKDFDFATDATPDEQITVYRDNGFAYFETGMAHGTITVRVGGELFEVTTFRTEAEHDGRYAVMTFTRDLQEDLARRDLTINSMAMTMMGEIIDPFGGQQDILDRKVRFVGDADQRIREDYLRILRWVRFHQRIANGQPFDPETIEAISRNVDGLRQISVERVWAEMSKALTYDNPSMMLALLDFTGITDIIGFDYIGDMPEEVVRGTTNPVSRIAGYYGGEEATVYALAARWKWSAAEQNQALAISKLMNRGMTREMQERWIVLEGYRPFDVAETCRMRAIDTDIESWVAPVFPVTGTHLMEKGMGAGPEMGRVLKNLKVKWFEANYQPSWSELVADAF